jgi:tRNA dimethylallyltransferase
VPILVGPTAVGKTAVALALAEQFAGEIVSADSRQIYRHMDIGTAKPTAAERQRVRHHFIDICNPDETYSAGAYGRAARECIDALFAAGIQPVVAGGSGFYLRALVDGLFAPQAADPDIKQKWRVRIAAEGAAAVHAELQRVDPASAARLHPNDTQRVIRALEVWEITGQPISDFQSGSEEPADFRPLFIGLIRPREELYRRIDQRVEQMIGDGLVEEIRRLAAMGYNLQHNALRTVGYQEILECPELLEPGADLAAVITLIQQHSRQYAKRQLTWFNRDERIVWIDVEGRPEEIIMQEILEKWEHHE